MTCDWLAGLAERRRRNPGEGITSLCSANPFVVESALKWAGEGPALIEATCNQVNQDGGYTGLTPGDFGRFVEDIAGRAGFNRSRLVFGGDHLGPNPWKHHDVGTAMARAEAMVAAYAAAGFSKIHLDTSMACRGDPEKLPREIVARRAAQLAKVAEETSRQSGNSAPVYVIGSEVPAPGGARGPLGCLAITDPVEALGAISAHCEAFARSGIADAADRIIALVVQPGVEFDPDGITVYDSSATEELESVLIQSPSLVFEAHSTDYQPPSSLAALVAHGFAILKVGPALTFALRQVLYGLDRIATELHADWRERSLLAVMERLMLAHPEQWREYYQGDHGRQHLLRHYSYSDRIRYFWSHAEAQAAVGALLQKLGSAAIPETLVSEFLPRCYEAVRDQSIDSRARTLIDHAIGTALTGYPAAMWPSAERKRRSIHEAITKEQTRPC